MSSVSDGTHFWRKVAVVAALLFTMATPPARGCPLTDSAGYKFEEDGENVRIPPKRDIFMSRGWGAGGGPAFTSRINSELSKRPRDFEVVIMDDDGLEMIPEPRIEPLRLKPFSYQHFQQAKAGAHRRKGHLPQLFISSDWGPLGK